MDADFELGEFGDLFDIGPKKRGGARPNSGPPKGRNTAEYNEYKARLMAGEKPDEDKSDPTSATFDPSLLAARKVVADVRKQEALAGLNELELKIKSGQYLPRAAYQEATATLLATLAQGLRSLPDMMERKFSLPPEALELVSNAIDTALANTAETLALFHGEPE